MLGRPFTAIGKCPLSVIGNQHYRHPVNDADRVGGTLRLRDVEPGDVGLYVRLRCDPLMTVDLGGPRPSEDMLAKVARDVGDTASDTAWNLVIVPDSEAPDTVAGSLHVYRGQTGLAEVGWMVLPEHQRRGVAKAAVRLLLLREQLEERWGELHAFTSTENAASNALCRSLPSRLLGEESYVFDGQDYPVNHWVMQPTTSGDRATC